MKKAKKTWLIWGVLLVAGWFLWKHAKAEATTPVRFTYTPNEPYQLPLGEWVRDL